MDEPNITPEGEETEGRDTNIVDLLSNLQDEIKTLKAQNKDVSAELNKFRLGYFAVSKDIGPPDFQETTKRVIYSLIDIQKLPDGDAQVMNIHRAFLVIAGECGNFIENHKSQNSIKIRIAKTDTDAKKEVEKIRTLPSERKAKLALNDAEKAVVSVRKMMGGAKLTVTQLIPIVIPFIPGMTEEKAREVIESLFKKEADAAIRKATPKVPEGK